MSIWGSRKVHVGLNQSKQQCVFMVMKEHLTKCNGVGFWCVTSIQYIELYGTKGQVFCTLSQPSTHCVLYTLTPNWPLPVAPLRSPLTMWAMCSSAAWRWKEGHITSLILLMFDLCCLFLSPFASTVFFFTSLTLHLPLPPTLNLVLPYRFKLLPLPS